MIHKLIHIAASEVQVAAMKVRLTFRYQSNYHKFKRAFYGLTLNSIGPLYGVRRKKGETHRAYERRILKVACRRGPEPIIDRMTKEGKHQ